MDFEPFGSKELLDLTEKDLETLYEVAEGWYVEYKSELSKAESIAKSIAAFANTYGGWVFYGVAEKSRSEQVAGSFPGIPEDQIDIGISRVRHAVAQSINPSTHYDVHVIRPSGAGLMQPGRAVLVVRVPKSLNTPHVHRSGLVYRRVGDGSEPVPETERNQLAQLFKRRNRLVKRYSGMLDNTVTFPSNQKREPFLRLFIISDLWKEKDLWFPGKIDRIREIMGDIEGEVATWPFDTIHNSVDGFVARQLVNNHPGYIGPTWELCRDLTSDIISPFRYANMSSLDDCNHFLYGYNHVDRFIRILRADGHTNLKIIDINCLFATLVGLSNIQNRLMEEVGCKGGFWFKAQIHNVNGFVPFLDCLSVLELFEKHRAPVGLRKTVSVFPGNGLNTFLETWKPGENPEDGSPLSPVLLGAFAMFTNIARALGMPDWIETGDKVENYYLQLIGASQRFQSAQIQRNEMRE